MILLDLVNQDVIYIFVYLSINDYDLRNFEFDLLVYILYLVCLVCCSCDLNSLAPGDLILSFSVIILLLLTVAQIFMLSSLRVHYDVAIQILLVVTYIC